jgi:hypothetical protein
VVRVRHEVRGGPQLVVAASRDVPAAAASRCSASCSADAAYVAKSGVSGFLPLANVVSLSPAGDGMGTDPKGAVCQMTHPGPRACHSSRGSVVARWPGGTKEGLEMSGFTMQRIEAMLLCRGEQQGEHHERGGGRRGIRRVVRVTPKCRRASDNEARHH